MFSILYLWHVTCKRGDLNSLLSDKLRQDREHAIWLRFTHSDRLIRCFKNQKNIAIEKDQGLSFWTGTLYFCFVCRRRPKKWHHCRLVPGLKPDHRRPCGYLVPSVLQSATLYFTVWTLDRFRLNNTFFLTTYIFETLFKSANTFFCYMSSVKSQHVQLFTEWFL